jgi:hypothetical protein
MRPELYRKVLVPESKGEGGEPVLLYVENCGGFYATFLSEFNLGTALLDYDRYSKDRLIERAVAMSQWNVDDLIAKAQNIEKARAQGIEETGS